MKYDGKVTEFNFCVRVPGTVETNAKLEEDVVKALRGVIARIDSYGLGDFRPIQSILCQKGPVGRTHRETGPN